MKDHSKRNREEHDKTKAYDKRRISVRRKAEKKGLSMGEKVVIGVILILVIWGAYSLSQPSNPPTTATTTSGAAPDFTLPVVGAGGLTGEKLTLSSFRGKVVLLEFMVPWCVHCQNMAPALEDLYRQFGPQNVVFISVSGAWNGATADDAAKFITDYGSTWLYVYDSSGSVFTAYGVSATPTFFIIGKNGQIMATYAGEVAAETLAAAITRFNV